MNVTKGTAVRLYYFGRSTGLTDVLFQLWDSAGTRVVEDGAATELGGKIYYYDLAGTYTNVTGDWIGYADSSSSPKQGGIQFRVEAKTGGGARLVKGAECIWDEKSLKRLWEELKKIEAQSKETKTRVMSNDMAPLSELVKANTEDIRNLGSRITEFKDSSQKQIEQIEDIVIEGLEPDAIERVLSKDGKQNKG